MDALFPPSLASYLKPKATTVFLLACGAAVREANSFNALVAFVRR
jgi:hypothetical protein